MYRPNILAFPPFKDFSCTDDPMYASLDLIVFSNGSNSLCHPSQDDISFQGHYLRDIADNVGNGKVHGGCLTLLSEFTFELESELQVVRFRDLLFGDEHTDKVGGHEALGQSPGQPLLALLSLHVSGGHVQAQGIAWHIVHG